MTALIAGVLSVLHLVVIGMLYLPLRLISTGIKSRAKVSGCLMAFKSQRFMFIRFGCAFLGGRWNHINISGEPSIEEKFWNCNWKDAPYSSDCIRLLTDYFISQRVSLWL